MLLEYVQAALRHAKYDILNVCSSCNKRTITKVCLTVERSSIREHLGFPCVGTGFLSVSEGFVTT